MSDLETVLKYYRKGLSIIPLNKGEKKPSIKWEEFQKHRATEEELRSWFKQDRNFGIICGTISGNLVVFDFDEAEAVNFVFTDFEKVKQKTMVVRTGKGYHIYFRTKQGVPSSKRTHLHLDIQSEGKYVVGPGSLHPSGAIYNSIGSEAVSEIDNYTEFLDRIDKKEELYDAAKFIGNIWQAGDRHEIALRLASLLHKQLHWEEEETKDFILSIMRMKEDNEEIPDRLRAIEDAYQKDYPYISSDLPKEFVDEILRLLPSDSKEIWRINLNENGSQVIYCDPTGVFFLKQGKDTKNIFPIFSKPLVLTDCYTIEGEQENDKIFSFSLGNTKYIGSKLDVINMISTSGITGINSRYFSEAINACVEYYISKKIVIPREAYPAVGVYRNGEKLVPAMPGIKEIDISPEYGEETYFVYKQFKKFSGEFINSLKILNRLWEFSSSPAIPILEGFSVTAPFFFALKSAGDLYTPLMILKGPRGTGKSSLGEIFTSYMYSIGSGDPSDATSEYRLLDFINGTTFPRLVDESENVKFEGNKFSPKASATLKYNSYKQIVGTRGEIKNHRVQKRIYYGRTPMIMAGNKIDMNDPALISRSIFINFNEKPDSNRALFRHEILDTLEKGFGQEIVKWICEHYSFSDLVNKIRNAKIDYNFRDSRREDLYAEVYVGLEILNDIYTENGIEFSYQKLLDQGEFKKVVAFLEEENIDEEEERQQIQILVDWARSMADVLVSYENSEAMPFNVALLSTNIKIVQEDAVKWIYMGQTGLNEFITQNRDIPFRTLSQCADELSKYYGIPRELFYTKKTVKIKDHALKVLKIPYDHLGVDSYGGGGYHSGGSDSKGGEQKGNQWLPPVTSPVTIQEPVNSMLQKQKVTSQPKKAYTGYFFKEKNSGNALDRSGYPVTFLDLDSYKHSNILNFYLIKKGNQLGNQWLPLKENSSKKIEKPNNINSPQVVTFFFSSNKEFDNAYFSGISEHAEISHIGDEFLYAITNPELKSKKWVSFVLSSREISEKQYRYLSKSNDTPDLKRFLPGTILDIARMSQLPETEIRDSLTLLAIHGEVTEENGIYEVKK